MINLIYSLQSLEEPGWPATDWATGVRFWVPAGSGIFHFSISSRLALGPIQPPEWVPGCGAPTHLQLVLWSRKHVYIYICLDCSPQLVKHGEYLTLVPSLFWFSSIPSLVIPRQMLGQYLDIMLQHLMAGWWVTNWKTPKTSVTTACIPAEIWTKCWTQVKPEPIVCLSY
jgi:hypothetical protein